MRYPKRQGQVIVILPAIILILAFMLFFVLDLHHTILLKLRAQDAGDASALNAARWQAMSCNTIGELNLLHALALASASDHVVTSDRTISAITNLQARICVSGSLMAFSAAQQAAKANGIPRATAFEDYLQLYTESLPVLVRLVGAIDLAEMYPGALDDYIESLRSIIKQGLYAIPSSIAPESALFALPTDPHYLTSKNFYGAVKYRNWCWFYFRSSFFKKYRNYASWPPYPGRMQIGFTSGDFFPLYLTPTLTPITSLMGGGDSDTTRRLLNTALGKLGHSPLTPPPVPPASDPLEIAQYWFLYNPAQWTDWPIMSKAYLPLRANLKPEYNYKGCDSFVTVGRDLPALNTANVEADSQITWKAAAKAFGFLELESGVNTPPNIYQLVLPAFSSVRLIPLSAANQYGFDFEQLDIKWIDHCTLHVPQYLANGHTHQNCDYCLQIRKWDMLAFRIECWEWLEKYGDTRCRGQGGPGGEFHGDPDRVIFGH